jgi:hypothetical protein
MHPLPENMRTGLLRRIGASHHVVLACRKSARYEGEGGEGHLSHGAFE